MDESSTPIKNLLKKPETLKEIKKNEVDKKIVNEPLPILESKNDNNDNNVIRKEYFGIKETDYKSTLLVFALILIFSSSIFYSTLQPYAPMLVGPDFRPTILGSVVVAIAASVIFLILKMISNC